MNSFYKLTLRTIFLYRCYESFTPTTPTCSGRFRWGRFLPNTVCAAIAWTSSTTRGRAVRYTSRLHWKRLVCEQLIHSIDSGPLVQCSFKSLMPKSTIWQKLLLQSIYIMPDHYFWNLNRVSKFTCQFWTLPVRFQRKWDVNVCSLTHWHKLCSRAIFPLQALRDYIYTVIFYKHELARVNLASKTRRKNRYLWFSV